MEGSLEPVPRYLERQKDLESSVISQLFASSSQRRTENYPPQIRRSPSCLEPGVDESRIPLAGRAIFLHRGKMVGARTMLTTPFPALRTTPNSASARKAEICLWTVVQVVHASEFNQP